MLISSKTFTTMGTTTNAQTAREPEVAQRVLGGDVRRRWRKHFCSRFDECHGSQPGLASTTAKNMFGFWDWVGGRYSMDSAIGLSTMLAIGPDNFRAMLDGFHEMDEHFRTAPFEQNLPVLMGLARRSGYTDFLGAADGGGAAVRAVPEALPARTSSS